jgi:hypothetical protein
VIRRYSVAIFAAALIIGGAGPQSAHALSGQYTILGWTGLQPSEGVFVTSNCTPAIAENLRPNNTGIDAIILPIGPTERGQHLTASWTQIAPRYAGLVVQFWVGCNPLPSGVGYNIGSASSPWTFRVPGDATWVEFITPLGAADTVVTISTGP